jgi:plastocyanin
MYKLLIFWFIFFEVQAANVRGTIVPNDEVAGLENFVVWIKNANAKTFPLKKGSTKKMQQKDKTFVPQTLAVSTKDKVDFKNLDNYFHNVFSLHPEHKFDLGLFKDGIKYADDKETKTKGESYHAFKKAGKVNVFCNIHPDMNGMIYIFDHSGYTQTNQNGEFSIDAKAGDTIVIDSLFMQEPKEIKIGKKLDLKKIKVSMKSTELNKKRKDGSAYPEKEIDLDEDDFY